MNCELAKSREHLELKVEERTRDQKEINEQWTKIIGYTLEELSPLSKR